MDSYSGSTQRRFISFYLEQENNGQPTQNVAETKDNSALDLPASSQQLPLETMDEEVSQPRSNELAGGNNQEVRESEDPESIQPQISAPLVSVRNPVSEEMDTESSQPQSLSTLRQLATPHRLGMPLGLTGLRPPMNSLAVATLKKR